MWPGLGFISGRFLLGNERKSFYNCCCCCLVTKSCLSLCHPMNYVFPTRFLCPWDLSGKNTEVGCYSRGPSWPRDWTCVFCIGGQFFTTEPLGKPHWLPRSWLVFHWSAWRLFGEFFKGEITVSSLITNSITLRISALQDQDLSNFLNRSSRSGLEGSLDFQAGAAAWLLLNCPLSHSPNGP